jgi:hypothetical protein
MNVGAIGAVHAGVGDVARALDTPPAVTSAPVLTASAPVATPVATMVAATAPAAPFANPAIVRIAENVAFAALQAGTAVVLAASSSSSSSSSSSASPNAVLSGDSGLLVQSYGAVALIEAPLALPPVYAQLASPAIQKVDPILRPAGARPVRA